MIAPYNPSTLNRIRAGATAHELGWDETFYQSICRRHGLAPIPSHRPPPIVPSAPDIVPAQPQPTPRPRQISKRGPRLFANGFVSLSIAVTAAVKDDIRAVGHKRGMSDSEVVRRAIAQALAHKGVLPDWRNGQSTALYVSTAIDRKLVPVLEAAAARNNINRPEFIRRAIHLALDLKNARNPT